MHFNNFRFFIMKNNNSFFRSVTLNQLKYVLTSLLVLVVLYGCESDDTLDDRAPTLKIDGVVKDEIKETSLTNDGVFLNMIIADNVGLKKYNVDIDSASVNVFSKEFSNLQYKLEHKKVELDMLAINYLYDVQITVEDINSNVTSFQFQIRINNFQKYEYLGLVGDATTAGWNPDASAAFTPDPDDPALFTYEGPFSATGEGAFKIATKLGGWCDGDWLFAPQANQSIAQKTSFVINDCGGPDNKWQVTGETAGTYLVTVDLREKTIDFEKKN